MRLAECVPKAVGNILLTENVNEIRIRNNCPVRICVDGDWFWVGKNGLEKSAVWGVAVGEVCDEIVKNACQNSIFAYEKMLVNGYFTLEDGCRIGVCGDMSAERCFRKFTSLCVRVPKVVRCVSDAVFEAAKTGCLIVVSPPSCGKTTYLRDIAAKLSKSKNVVVSDERGELFPAGLNANHCCDVLRFANREYAFGVAVRSLAAEYLVCDELTADDLPWVERCLCCGVKLICSLHGECLTDTERFLGKLCGLFSTVVLLDKNHRETIYSVKNGSTISENGDL